MIVDDKNFVESRVPVLGSPNIHCKVCDSVRSFEFGVVLSTSIPIVRCHKCKTVLDVAL